MYVCSSTIIIIIIIIIKSGSLSKSNNNIIFLLMEFEVPHQIIYNQLARHLLNTCSNRCMHMHTPGNLLNMVQGRRFSSNWDDLVCDPQGCS